SMTRTSPTSPKRLPRSTADDRLRNSMAPPVIPPERLLACLRRVPPFERSRFRPFRCAGQRIGWVVDGFADELASDPGLFRVEPDAVYVAERLGDIEARSAAVNAFVWQRRHLPWF